MIAPEQAFQAAIAAAGLAPPATIIADGAIHRFSTNGKPRDDSGWYLLRVDGCPAGAFGCWREGVQSTWSARPDMHLTQAEQDIQRQRIRSAQAQRAAKQAQDQHVAALVAAQRWHAAKPCAQHAYTLAKGVTCCDVRIDGNGCLIVPMRDATNTLHSLQSIAPDGGKRFLTGGRVKGCFHLIGNPSGTLIVCEGYATGATIHDATGHAVAVAFNAGNLIAVAMTLRARYAGAQIVVAADDDWLTPGNPGQSAAKQAVLAAGGIMAVPWFPTPRPDKATDFNDMQTLAGSKAVRACFAELEEAAC